MGVGASIPDPNGMEMLEQVCVPCGSSIAQTDKTIHLLHNEYIVYRTEQVKLRYF